MTKYEELAEATTKRIIEMIENGEANGSWVMPWHAGAMSPKNASTGKHYRGGNIAVLMIAAIDNGFAGNDWATYKQWQKLGAQVVKGSKGTRCVKWSRIVREDDNGVEKSFMIPNVFTVFNADQVDGYEPKVVEALSETERVENAEAFFAAVPAEIVTGNRASFSPSGDYVTMPSFESFFSGVAYYGTLAHELVHWTGHADRLGRPMSVTDREEYAKEELVAELGSSMLCSQLGLEQELRADHAEYIKSWLGALRNDSKFLFSAMSKASKACELLESFSTEAAVEKAA